MTSAATAARMEGGKRMDNRLKVVGGVGLGAGLLFLLDPAAGRRRLRQVRDRVTTLTGGAEGLIEPTDPSDLAAPRDDRPEERFELDEQPWTPAARLLVSAAGGGLALYGAKRRGRIGAALGSLGVGLLVRSLTDLTLRTLAGRARPEGTRDVDVQRAIHVDATPAEVFALWVDYDNFPRLFSQVREVRDGGDGRSRWVVEGPAGMPMERDVVLTRFETERELAWRTVGDPDEAQQLQVSFRPDAEGGTRVEVRLSRAPQASVSGEDRATLLGVDPERQVEEDLVRMKAHVETRGPENKGAE
jgi:uncharacterized membrane protein